MHTGPKKGAGAPGVTERAGRPLRLRVGHRAAGAGETAGRHLSICPPTDRTGNFVTVNRQASGTSVWLCNVLFRGLNLSTRYMTFCGAGHAGPASLHRPFASAR